MLTRLSCEIFCRACLRLWADSSERMVKYRATAPAKMVMAESRDCSDSARLLGCSSRRAIQKGRAISRIAPKPPISPIALSHFGRRAIDGPSKSTRPVSAANAEACRSRLRPPKRSWMRMASNRADCSIWSGFSIRLVRRSADPGMSAGIRFAPVEASHRAH
jgi:hypothetical protein